MSGRRGVILVTVLWILFFVGLIAMGLGHLAAEEMSLLKISAGRLRAYTAARSGLAVAEQRLLGAAASSGTTTVSLKDRKKLYAGIPAGEGVYFDVGAGKSCPASSVCWGPLDEAARYNVNMIDAPGVEADILRTLVDSVAPGEGDTWVRGIINFRNGPERNGKTRPFYVLEELLYVPGIVPETFARLRDMLTVFPYDRSDVFSVNMTAANARLVDAAFRAAAAYVGGNASADIRSFLQCRDKAADPGRECPLPGYMGFLALSDNDPFGFFRIRSTGLDTASGIRLVIEEVVKVSETRPGIEVVYWHRD